MSSLFKALGEAIGEGPEALSRVLKGLTPNQAGAVRRVLPSAPARPPVRAAAEETTQLRLPLTQPGKGARAYSPARSATSRDVETVRLSQQPRAADMPSAPRGASGGQGSLDYGTANSMGDLARRAADYYGVPAEDLGRALAGPNGNKVLSFLEAGNDLPTAIRRSGGGPIVPRGSAELYGPGGRLVSSPGGDLIDMRNIPVNVQDMGRAFGRPLNSAEEIVTGMRTRLGGSQMEAPLNSAEELVTGLRNSAGGVQLGDLSQLFTRENLAKAALLAGGAAGVGAGISNYANMFQDNAGGGSPVGGNMPVQDRAVLFGERDGTPLGGATPGSTVPPAPTLPGPGQPGSMLDPTRAGVPIITGGTERDSARRAALSQYAPDEATADRALEPKDPSQYRSIEDYYAARQRYANAPSQRKELVNYARGLEAAQAEQTAMQQWAAANPALVYELRRRQLANPAANQQTGESVTTTQVMTSLGSNNTNNAVGNSIAVGEASVAPTQGAFELMDATRPLVQPNLQRTEELIRRSYYGY